MKKVFAFLSTLVLTIACVGVALSPVKAADVEVAEGKWIVNPTLEQNEIPMYIMDSIMSTFPNYYDNNAKPDPNWEGASRVYPWNGVKLSIPQMNEQGVPTGKVYMPYFTGAMSAVNADGTFVSGTGNYVMKFTTDGSTFTPPGATSLSFARYNTTNQDIEVKMAQEPINVVTYLIFDGQGKAIRGVSNAAFFQSEDWKPLHCYAEDGSVIALDENYTGCARHQVPKIDPETGEPVVDGDGNPVLVDGDYKVVTQRVLWQYFENKPENLNANGYLGEGWDAHKWDYYLPEYKVAFIYTSSDANYGNVLEVDAKKHYTNVDVYAANDAKILANGVIEGATAPAKDASIADYNKQVGTYNTLAKAAGKEELQTLPFAAGTKRSVYANYTVPKGGIFYCFGYLDRGKPGIMNAFNQMYLQAMKYGREEGYNVKAKTYDYEGGGIGSKVYMNADGSFYPLEGKTNANGNPIIEVVRGVSFKPIWNLNFTPLSRYWAVKDDITSFKSSTENIKISISVNGALVVDASWPYTNDSQKTELAEDFLTDFYNYLVAAGTVDGTKMSATEFMHGVDKTEGFNGTWNTQSWSLFNGQNADGTAGNGFLLDAHYRTKWAMFVSFLVQLLDGRGYKIGETGYKSEKFWGSAYTTIARIKAYFQNESYYNPAVVNTIPKTASRDELTLNTTDAVRDFHYVVKYDVENVATGVKGSYTIDYAVVAVKTPVITLKPAAFFKRQGEALNVNLLATATNGYGYEGNIYGRDITSRLQVEIPGLTAADYKSLPAGQFNVIFTVFNEENPTSPAVKQGVLYVTDTVKPIVEVQDIVHVPFGGKFHFTDGIVSAVDNLDGNLKNHNFRGFQPFVLNSDEIDTTKPGTYMVEFEVYDRAGNKTVGEYKVIVAKDTSKATDDKFQDLLDQVAELQDLLNQEPAQAGGCKAPAATTAVTFVSLVGLLATAAFVVLRRKH